MNHNYDKKEKFELCHNLLDHIPIYCEIHYHFIKMSLNICRIKKRRTLSFCGIFYFTHKRYEVQVNIGCNLQASSPVCSTGVVHVLLHLEVTSDIDMDFMKYKGSLFSKSHLFQFLEISLTLDMICNTRYHIHNIAMVLLEHLCRLHVDRHICKLIGYISDHTLTKILL